MAGKKRVHHSPKQIVEKLQEADRLLNAGQSLGQVLQALGVSKATYHRWRNQYDGMKAQEAQRLKEWSRRMLGSRSCWQCAGATTQHAAVPASPKG